MFKRTCSCRVRDLIRLVVPIAMTVVALCAVASWANRGVGAHSGEVAQKKWPDAREIKRRFPRSKHEEFMRRAIGNARLAGVEKRTGGAFGAVIVNQAGQVFTDGCNQVVANFDPTWHGEMEAIRKACAKFKSPKLDGCILYTSSEPCPMCLAAAYWAGLDGIVYGATVADSKRYGSFDDGFMYEQIAKPAAQRNMPEVQILREDALKVWKEYSALPP
jgi:guanine deaminase